MAHWLLVLAFLLLPVAVGEDGGVPPAPAATDLSAVEVSAVEKTPLRLVTWDYGGGTTAPGLDGVLIVSVANRGSTPVALRNLGVHGLRWVNQATGEPFVVVHPCECALLLGGGSEDAPVGGIVRVEPGGTALVTLEDFGCNEPWVPPPQGTWTLTFRLLPAEAEVTPPAGERPDFPHLQQQCRARLLEEAFWAGSVASPPFAVTLGTPKRVKVK